MTDQSRPDTGPEKPPAERLESWKEIAAYLRRDVRTVQRWEQSDGLPVHRHKRSQRPIPYAYKAELDAWWTGRSETSPPAVGDTASIETRQSWRPAIAVVAALLVVVATIGTWKLAQARSARTVLGIGRLAGPSLATGDRSGAPSSSIPEKSIAVLPFLDLSEGMKNEEFADGMTEELIDRLNKVAGLRVPAPTASFYFKNKHVSIPEIAKTLRVAHVLDGSVRKSGLNVRVAARLIRADSGDVVWSETYERRWDDILVVQDDIAGAVTLALTASIERARPS